MPLHYAFDFLMLADCRCAQLLERQKNVPSKFFELAACSMVHLPRVRWWWSCVSGMRHGSAIALAARQVAVVGCSYRRLGSV